MIFFFYYKRISYINVYLNFLLASHHSETHLLFKNICSEFWCHFRAMRIIALMDIKLCLKNYEILFTLVTTNQKELFIYHNYFTKTDQKLFIHLNFCIVFREIKKKNCSQNILSFKYLMISKKTIFPVVRYQKEKSKIPW